MPLVFVISQSNLVSCVVECVRAYTHVNELTAVYWYCVDLKIVSIIGNNWLNLRSN